MSEMVIQRLAADYLENEYSKETIYQKPQNIFLLDQETLMEYTGQIFEG